MQNKNQTQTGEGNAPRVTMTDEQMVNLLKIGLETDLDQTFRYWRDVVGDDEAEDERVNDCWSLRDDGCSDGQGESYAERNV